MGLNPERAASYNNRAQALRLAGRPESAMKDLDMAVRLSQGKGKAGSSALCQRGVLLRKEGRDDDAIEDFKKAATQVRHLISQLINPYKEVFLLRQNLKYNFVNFLST